MNGLTERDILTFGAVADTFFASVPGPNGFWTQSASDLGLLPRFRRLLSSLDDQTTSDLHDALKLLSSRGGGLLMYQRPARFTDLSGDARREALLRMARSPLLAARQLYGTLKQLTTALLATASPGAKRGPLWAAMGYPEPPPAPAPEMNSDVLRLTQLKRTTTLSCDVVVVGSGYTGLMGALTLARGGRDVLLLEAESIGYGASSRNGGQVGSGNQRFTVKQLTDLYGRDKARALILEGIAALDYVKSFIADENIECHLRVNGRFRGASRPEHYENMARDLEDLQDVGGVEAQMVQRGEQTDEIGSELYHGGMVLPCDASVHPALYVRGLS